ncbi:hypothetical protein EON77_12690, partial [bacterium]
MLVALPDRVVPDTVGGGLTTPAAFVAALVKCGVSLRSDGRQGENGLTIGEPVSPLEFDVSCLDRVELGRWMTEGAGEVLPAVRSMGILHARVAPATPGAGLFEWYRDAIEFRTEGHTRIGSLQPQLLRAIGMLSDGEWRTVTGGGAVTLATPPGRAEAIDAMTYVTARMLEPTRNPLEEKPIPDVIQIGTVAFPSGLPKGTRLVLEREDEPVFWEDRNKLWLDASGLVGVLFPDERYPTEVTDATIARAAGSMRIREGRRGIYTFRVGFDARFQALSGWNSDEVGEIRDGLRYSELSDAGCEALREETEASRVFFAKNVVK